jgi:hypothetical protein
MNIQLLEGFSSTSLRKILPNSRFYYTDFDSFIVAIETETKSIIYDLDEVIKHMLKIENPYTNVCKDYRDFEYMYDVAFEKLAKTDANIGIEELKEQVEYNIKNHSNDNPYSFIFFDEIIQNIIR